MNARYPAAMWTRRQTFPEADDDFVVLRDGETVGRVYRSDPQARSGRDLWFWSVLVQPTASGWAGTLEAALEAVRERVG